MAVACRTKRWEHVTEAHQVEGDRILAEAVAVANIPTFLMVLVQLTG
jgi:hypothetical protein